MRKTEITRTTAETDIKIALNIDGTGKSDISTGCGFFDHMMTLFASHGRFDLDISCKGDTQVDYHHSVEDIGITLGEAFKKALGDKRGICRYGSIILPMDEALVLCSLDISGRAYLSFRLDIPTEKTGDFDNELVREFFLAFVRSAGITLHINLIDGINSHHIIEATFKAFARALRQSCKIDADFADEIPSTKEVL